MDKKKLAIILLAFVLIVLSAVLLTIKLFNLEKSTLETSNNNIIQNYIENNIEGSDTSNNIINNSVQNDTSNEVEDETIINTEQEEIEEPQTNEEKAIAIVEKIWKNENNVYCSFEEINSEGNYVVRVTKETRVLCWYTINVETGEYTVKQNI